MPLIDFRATFRCDNCNARFSVEVDSAGDIPAGWSGYDVAENAVMGSVGYEGPRQPNGTLGCSSVQDGRCLCGPCTSEADAEEE